MLTYERNYSARPCVKCGDEISAPKGPQRYCAPCNSKCSVEGCANVIRAGGKCSTHYRQKYEVASYEPINGSCGVAGCGRPLKQKGLCSLHYGRAYHGGDIGDAAPRETSAVGVPCKVDGCGKPARGKGYCGTHYRRLQTSGEVGGAELLRRRQGEGYIDEAGYRMVCVDGVYVYEHRYVMEKILGRPLVRGENVHHKNGDRAFNDPSNLELWSVQQPAGQRVEDKVAFAKDILARYEPGHQTFTPSEISMGLLAMGM